MKVFYSLMKIFCFELWIVAVGTVSFSPLAMSYNDEIGVSIEELWQASKDVIEPHGLAHEDVEKLEMESSWIKDRVRRKTKGLLKGILFQGYERRYRIKVRLEENKYTSHMYITGTYQQKRSGQRPSVPWQRMDPDSQDYLLEKIYFDKIIEQLSQNRNPKKQQEEASPTT